MYCNTELNDISENTLFRNVIGFRAKIVVSFKLRSIFDLILYFNERRDYVHYEIRL